VEVAVADLDVEAALRVRAGPRLVVDRRALRAEIRQRDEVPDLALLATREPGRFEHPERHLSPTGPRRPSARRRSSPCLGQAWREYIGRPVTIQSTALTYAGHGGAARVDGPATPPRVCSPQRTPPPLQGSAGRAAGTGAALTVILRPVGTSWSPPPQRAPFRLTTTAIVCQMIWRSRRKEWSRTYSRSYCMVSS